MSGTEKTNGSLALTPQIITIPAKEPERTRKLRVAAYTRVSSNSRDQLHSFVVQNAHYSKLITDNPEWELVDVYADKGITGTSVEKRDDFLRMMEDCRRGRIDRILVKSSTRFARNTKESLEAVRELAALGVSVYFEEQNIDTAKTEGEVLTALYAAMAQKGSEAISERTSWGIQRRMEDKKFKPTPMPLGYLKDEEGNIFVDEEQAACIRNIFEEFLKGKNSQEIASSLEDQQSLGQGPSQYRWTVGAVSRILRNEKYIGDSLWQKTFTTNTLPRRQMENRGQRRQFYVKNTHPPIVDEQTFQKTQKILFERQRKFFDSHVGESPLHGKIKCGECGASFRKITSSGVVYQMCRNHANKKDLCSIKQIPESEIYGAFLRLYYKLKHYGPEILGQLISDLHDIRSGSLLWSEGIVEINKQISDIACQERLLAQLKQQAIVDPDIFISRSNQLAEQRREAKLKKSRILRSEDDQTVQRTQELLDILEEGPDLLMTFDGALFSELVEKITIQNNSTAIFRLINGLEIPEHFERRK